MKIVFERDEESTVIQPQARVVKEAYAYNEGIPQTLPLLTWAYR